MSKLPVYEYRCLKCGHEDTEVRNVEGRNEPKKCNADYYANVKTGEILSKCNGEMKLKISRTSFTFKQPT